MDLRMAVGVLELLGGGEVALHVSDFSEHEDFRNADTRVSRVPAVRTGVLCDVRDGGVDREELARRNDEMTNVGMTNRNSEIPLLARASSYLLRYHRMLNPCLT